MIEIIFKNRTPKVTIVGIKKGVKSFYFKGEKFRLILEWFISGDIKLKQFINGLR